MPVQVAKHKRQHSNRKVSVFKQVDHTPSRLTAKSCPVNLLEAKEKFLRHGILPQFKLKVPQESNDPYLKKKRNQVNFDCFKEAKSILDTVKQKFGNGCNYVAENYGSRIDIVQGTEVLAEYLKANNCEGEMTIYWTPQLECSAKMMWHGPNLRYNRPELRKYSLVIKNSSENLYLRERGLLNLANHEIGTHYMRMINDGFQPWFSDRKKFGLKAMRTRESAATEEGLASVNTLINAKYKYFWGPALTYYIACMASEMSFRELYDHLEEYVPDREQRWKSCMRVKRHISDPNAHGGSGADQVYFEGVVEILRNIDNIDFHVLYSGKVCIDEIPRVRRVARTDCIKTPKFLADIERYKKTLRYMAYINGLGPKPVHTKIVKGKATPKLSRKQSSDGRGSGSVNRSPSSRMNSSSPDGKRSRNRDRESASPELYRVKRTPLTQPISRIVHVTEDLLNPLDDIDEAADETDDDEDRRTTVTMNTTMTTGSLPNASVSAAAGGSTRSSSYKLLGRPKSSPNKVKSDSSSTSSGSSSSSKSETESLNPPKRVDWFGLLERKWDY